MILEILPLVFLVMAIAFVSYHVGYHAGMRTAAERVKQFFKEFGDERTQRQAEAGPRGH